MDTEIRAEATAMANNWWLFLITGVAWLLLAILVLRFDVSSLAAVGVLIGVMFLGAGINEFMASTTVSGGWRFVHIALGALFLLGALWGFFRPVNTFFALASVLGFLLVLKGTMDIVGAVITKPVNELWWLGLTVGILEVMLAFWVSQQYYPARAGLILVWVGFMAVFRGITEIVLAFHLRGARHQLEAA
ncbi:MAG: HdeD family acid-resistance protein [Actinomycetota bacterium]